MGGALLDRHRHIRCRAQALVMVVLHGTSMEWSSSCSSSSSSCRRGGGGEVGGGGGGAGAEWEKQKRPSSSA